MISEGIISDRNAPGGFIKVTVATLNVMHLRTGKSVPPGITLIRSRVGEPCPARLTAMMRDGP